MAQIDRDFDKLMFGKKHHLFGGKRNPKNYRWHKKTYGKNTITWERKPGHAVWVEKKPTGWQVYTEKASCDCGLGMPVFNKPVSKKEAMQAAMKKRKRFF